MPTIPTVAEQLSFLIGRHAGTEQVHPSPWGPGGAGSATASAESALDGAVVLHRHSHQRDGAAAFEVLNVFSTDPATGEVLLHAHDSVGFPPDPPARGTWHDGVLVLDRRTPRGSSRTTFEPLPTGYRWRKVYRRDETGPWTPVVDGEFGMPASGPPAVEPSDG